MAALRTVLLTACTVLLVSTHAHAATFAVNSTGDGTDASTGDGVCAVAPGGPCTLRAAIVQANASPGADTVSVPTGTYATATALPVTSIMTITGAGARSVTVAGAVGQTIITVSGAGAVTITDMTITGGSTGISVASTELTLDRILITGNTLSSVGNVSGAGMKVNAGAKVFMKRSALEGNTATSSGGQAIGAGIYVVAGELEIDSSTIAGNAAAAPGLAQPAWGGGIAAVGGSVKLRHVTMSGNSALSNNAAHYGGNIYAQSPATVTAADSIFVGGISSNGHQNCSGVKPVPSGVNIDSGTTCSFGAGQLSSTDPQLNALGDVGGSTNALSPKSTSPALHQAGACPADGVDQRGASAPAGAGCDIGSVELSSNVAVRLEQSRTDVVPGGDVAFIATVTNPGFDPAEAASLDLTPSGASEVVTAAPSAGSCTKTVRCELGTIAAGAQITITIVLRAGTGTALTAAATVASSSPGASAGDDTATASVTITGSPGGPGGDPANAAPALGALKLSGKARSGKTIKLTSTLSEAAKLSIRVQRLTTGRRSGKSCSAKARRGSRCTITRSVASLSASGIAGKLTITIPSKLARKTLAPGRYRVTVQATDAGGLKSVARTVVVTVARA